jgi:hypothetical protein
LTRAGSSNPCWRVTELRARTAESVFHFDVQRSGTKKAEAVGSGGLSIQYILLVAGSQGADDIIYGPNAQRKEGLLL